MCEKTPATIRVEIAYADSTRQILQTLEISLGSTVADALRISDIANTLGGGAISAERIGIFSQPVALDGCLCDGDRIEIYRELRADPKESRRRRARDNAVKA
jgi:putative ubiquitin-RnfH superfamily antitoxin RatB of RatAB toxin-antitoxin module